MQNVAARVVTRTRKHHITPILYTLQWLPVEFRIRYKLLCLVFRCLIGTAPAYLCSLLSMYEPPRSLRSQDKNLLIVPKVKTVQYGSKSFAYAGAMTWNSLPQSLRDCCDFETFRSNLKTHLFKIAFEL